MTEAGQIQRSGDIWNDIPTLLAAAHELKSPLVLIRQLALQLQDNTEVTDETAERIRLTAERSLGLVEGLTRAARLEDALFEVEPINVHELYDSVAHELGPLARALHQTIVTDVAGSAPCVIGNRSLLRSVLIGLCDNALTHNDPTKPIILLARQHQSDTIQLGIRDYGPRTAQLATIQQRLGSPLPMQSRPRSSGLGLLIAEQFVRHMDARLSLVRHHGVGVTFHIDMPRSRQLSLLGVSV